MSEFDVILILEELDLSLAVLALKFCWEVEDVVHFKLNSMVTKTPRRPLSPEAVQKLKDYNWPDEYLYSKKVANISCLEDHSPLFNLLTATPRKSYIKWCGN